VLISSQADKQPTDEIKHRETRLSENDTFNAIEQISKCVLGIRSGLSQVERVEWFGRFIPEQFTGKLK